MSKIINRVESFYANHKKTVLWALPMLVFVIIMLMSSWRTPMWMDEYVFYRLSIGLPNYSTTADWFYEDRPAVLNPSITWEDKSEIHIDKDEAFMWIYNNKVYYHTPLAPALMYPITKSLDVLAQKGVIPTIESEPGYPIIPKDMTDAELAKLSLTMDSEFITKILRGITILIFCLAMWIVFKLMQLKVKSVAYLYAVPVAGVMQLLTGTYLFYWDIFMMFFMVLTLYLMERKSKWAYVTACCMVNTKMFIGLLFLIPLIVKNWRMVFAGFSLVPFYLVIVAYNGWDILYPITHYITGTGMSTHNYVYTLYDASGYILLLVSLGIPFFAIMTIPLFAKIKKYPEYIALWLCGNLYAWGSGLGITHLSCLVYVGALMFPLVFYEFNLYPKLVKIFNWFQAKKVNAE